LTHLDSGLMALTVTLAVTAALLAGIYPAWRAARISIGWQLKEQ
jgi:putative ABC transport system permease protein